MTELTKYVCDLCGAEQELNTQPQRMETNYIRFVGMIANLSRDLSIQALCPKCAGAVGDFIKRNRSSTTNADNKTVNRVSTIR